MRWLAGCSERAASSFENERLAFIALYEGNLNKKYGLLSPSLRTAPGEKAAASRYKRIPEEF